MHQKHCRHTHVLRIIKNLKHAFFRRPQPLSEDRAIHGQHNHIEPKRPHNRNPETHNRRP